MSGSYPKTTASRPRTVCHLQSLPDLPTLRTWAREHAVPVAYLGPDGEGCAMYGAADGAEQRVAVVAGEPDPHPHPLSWKAPTLRLPRVRLAS